MHAVKEVGIGKITWSDHAPVFLKYNLSNIQPNGAATWNLKESLLQDISVLKDVRREAMWYFQTNDTPDCDPGVIWEAHKVVIWGVLLKPRARIKKEIEEKLASLRADISRLETLHKSNTVLERDLLTACRQITDLLL